MRKIELTPEQLEAVTKLRQRGFTWLGIQRETRIPRRVVARAYKEYELIRSSDDLKAARRELATEEFREHRDALIALAEKLVAHLDAPKWEERNINADQYLDLLWASNLALPEEPADQSTSANLDERNRRRMIRQNQMLFKALREHTSRDVRWEALDEWKAAWNGYIAAMPALRHAVAESMKSLMYRMAEPETDIKAELGTERLEEASNLVAERACLAALNGGDAIEPQWDIHHHTGDRRETKEVPDILAQTTERLATQLPLNAIVKPLADSVRRARLAAQELEEMLDPLLLRPLILRTRCFLCPM